MSNAYTWAQRAGSALLVQAVGSLTGALSERIIETVAREDGPGTSAITISLRDTTHVQWDALCRLTMAATDWRHAGRSVLLEVARPSHLSLAATFDDVTVVLQPSRSVRAVHKPAA